MLKSDHKNSRTNLIKYKDQEKFEAVYRMACQVDAHNPYATSFKFRDFVNDYCSRNGMVDPDEEQTHNLRQHLIGNNIILIRIKFSILLFFVKSKARF